jgi:hypothetical protein
MKDFVLLFRHPDFAGLSKKSPQEMQALQKRWMDWSTPIREQGKLANAGMRLAHEGKVLKPNGVITDGPFAEIKEILGSFIVVKAENMEEALTIAHGCPILETGGSVEIRPLFAQ